MAKSPKKDDPTKDPKFQRVVQHFLHTPPKPKQGGAKSPKRKKQKQSENG